MIDLRPLLERATTIELIDWPRPDVPAALVRAGYTVVGHGPDGYTHHGVAATPPVDAGVARTFTLADGTCLVCRRLDGPPEAVDIVTVYRPAEEQPDIAREAAARGARALWIQRGAEASPEAQRIAEAADLVFVDDACIADTVRGLGITKDPTPSAGSRDRH